MIAIPDATGKPPACSRLAGVWRRVWLSAAAGAVYFTAIILGDAKEAGSTMESGLGHALFFGTCFAVVSIPILLAVQYLIARLVNRILRRPPGPVRLWEFIPMALLSALFLWSSVGSSEHGYYRRFVSDTVPPSLHDLRVWHTSGFGNSSWVLCFKIEPTDMDKVLSRHSYSHRSNPPDPLAWESALPAWLPADSGIPQPIEPPAHEYGYSEPGPGGGLWITIITNARQDTVYVRGSFD